MALRAFLNNPWLRFQDIVPPNMPQLVRTKIWCSNLEYRDRAFLAAFFYANGVSPDLASEVLYFCNTYANRDRVRKILDLFIYWDHPVEGFDRRSRYYAFNCILDRVVDLNGNPRPPALFIYPPIGEARVQRDRDNARHYHC